MFDDGAFEDIAVPDVQIDPLKFRDERRYADRSERCSHQDRHAGRP